MEYISFESFLSSNMVDGQYSCLVQKGALEIMLSGFDQDSDTSYFMVGFSGAVTNRENKVPPFFSGLGLANELQIPILAISDPTLNMSDLCNIGWYAGNKSIPNLPNIISELIIAISEKYRSVPILFGGSAGGYASLLQATLLPIKAKVLVWNPQTNIANYVQEYVIKYVNTAFPQTFNLNDIKDKTIVSDFLHKLVKYYSVIQRPINENIDILYLQNLSDWHLISHTGPYFNSEELEVISNNVLRSKSVTLQIGSWGEGHVAPPKQMIKRIIELMSQNYNSIEISQMIRKEFTVLENHQSFYLKDIENKLIGYNIYMNDNNRYLGILLDSEPLNKINQCAVYFIKNNERIKVIWYQRANIFNISAIDFDAIQIFIKDIFGNIKYRYFDLKNLLTNESL